MVRRKPGFPDLRRHAPPIPPGDGKRNYRNDAVRGGANVIVRVKPTALPLKVSVIMPRCGSSENVASLTFKIEEAAYVEGVLAGKMTKTGVKPVMDQPVTLMGKLHVGEMRENGYLTGIYRMEGDRMDAGPDQPADFETRGAAQRSA